MSVSDGRKCLVSLYLRELRQGCLSVCLCSGRPPQGSREPGLPGEGVLCPILRISVFTEASAGFDDPGHCAALPAPGATRWEQAGPGPAHGSRAGSPEPQPPWACDSGKIRPDPGSGGLRASCPFA